MTDNTKPTKFTPGLGLDQWSENVAHYAGKVTQQLKEFNKSASSADKVPQEEIDFFSKICRETVNWRIKNGLI